MSMLDSRYNFIRERLIQLYDIVQHRTYRIWIAPEKLMSLDQLRSRPTYKQEGFVNDSDFYSEKQMRIYRIPQMLDLLVNIQSVHDFGFEKPTRSITEIYEAIMEYNCLWVEIFKNAPGFKTPPLAELRELENFAYILFSEYKRIKPFIKRESQKAQYEYDTVLQGKGLAGFGALFGSPSLLGKIEPSELSFYSHLDEIMPHHHNQIAPPVHAYLPAPFSPFAPSFTPQVIQHDSLFAVEQPHITNPNWIFKEG